MEDTTVSKEKSTAPERRKHAPKKISVAAVMKNIALVGGAAAFLGLTFIPGTKPTEMTSVFWIFAILPGLIGIANHLVTIRQRVAKHLSSEEDRQAHEAESEHRPTLPEAVAAAMLLSAVFLIVARAEVPADQKVDGWVYAGYGAYISTLWFLLVRLNANALSPRFLINSTLKVSIAVFIGYIAARSDLFPDSKPVATLYFAIGLFHAWAIQALKRTAMTIFGIKPAQSPDVSLGLIDGLDDDAADVLQEIGITSAQHLATMHAPEVCGRTLYPRERVLDWIDQSILAVHTNGRLDDLRVVGIRSAYSLVTIARHLGKNCPLEKAATVRFQETAKRLGLSCGDLLLMVECIRKDPAYIELENIYPNRHKVEATSTDVPPKAPIDPLMVPVKDPVPERATLAQ